MHHHTEYSLCGAGHYTHPISVYVVMKRSFIVKRTSHPFISYHTFVVIVFAWVDMFIRHALCCRYQALRTDVKGKV